jgi:hypothetical protein
MLLGTVFTLVGIYLSTRTEAYFQCSDFQVLPGAGDDIAFAFPVSGSKNFTQSLDYCKSNVFPNSTLPYVTSFSIAAFICQSKGSCWIPLSQAANQTDPKSGWAWSNGTQVSVMPVPWSGSEPNDAGGTENGDENCGQLDCLRNGINDYSCSAGMDIVCQIPCELVCLSF